MNENFEDRLCGAALRGLENRLVDVPSVTSVEVVKRYAAQQASRVRTVRSLCVAFSTVASLVACVALIIGVVRQATFDRVHSDPAGDYGSYLTLTVLTTVFSQRDDGELMENGAFFSDLEVGTGFDAFAESLLRMQDSASVLDSAVAWN